MALTVETGSGVTGADSYVTLAEFTAYATARGWTLGDATTNEIALRRAFDAINRLWTYRGLATVNGQVGAFPRYNVGFAYGVYVDSDAIPQPVKDAQFELARLILDGLDPFAAEAGTVISESSKVGPISETVEYAGGKTTSPFRGILALLRPYLDAGAGQRRMVRG